MPEEEDGSAADSGWSRWWFILLGVALLLVAFGAYRAIRIAMVRNKREALRAEGYPVTLEELNEWYRKPPPEENAAPVYRKALSALKDLPEEDREKVPFVMGAQPPPPGAAPSPEAAKAAREHLARNERALQLAHEAAGLERCRYPVDLRDGFATNLPHLQKLRSLARLLGLRALMAATQGQPARAARAVKTSIAAAESLKEEPLIVSQLARMACLGISWDSLRHAMTRVRMTGDDLGALGKALKEAGDGSADALKRGLIGDLCILQGENLEALLRMTGSVPTSTSGQLFGPDWGWSGQLLFYRLAGMKGRDRLTLLEQYEKIEKLFKKPPPKQIAAAEAIERRVGAHGGSGADWMNLLVAMGFPAVPRAVVAHLRTVVLLRAARAATAVERFRREQGRLPDDLSELTPDYLQEVPKDPFDGKPLRYKKVDRGYLIYSIGDDGKDDGGKSGQFRVRPDVTFRVAPLPGQTDKRAGDGGGDE